MRNSKGGPFLVESLSLIDSFSRLVPAAWLSCTYGEREREIEEFRGPLYENKLCTNKHAEAVTFMTAVELGGEKRGGLSLTSDMSMLRVTVEDMAGEPLSKACTDREYLDT